MILVYELSWHFLSGLRTLLVIWALSQFRSRVTGPVIRRY